MKPPYSTLFFFETGQWWDWAMLLIATCALALTAWLIQRSKTAVVVFFIIAPILLTVFWWPYSTKGTNSAGWFPVVKQYSALAGSLCLVALQYVKKLRLNRWYLLIPPAILALNIAEAVVRDFQCFGIHGVDPTQGMVTWGGPWNIMNGIAGILNLLAISGWCGIFISKKEPAKAIIWGDLTVGWIVAYDIWNFAYVYNCLADRAWYSGIALLAACTIPAFMRSGRGAWIQYRAYTLTLWSAVVLTFPHLTQDSIFAHRSAHNPTAMFIVSALSLLINVVVFARHIHRIITLKRNPLNQPIYAETAEYAALVRDHATDEDKARTAAMIDRTPEELHYLTVS